jgi:archaeal flagellar protein FlaG
MAQNVISTAIIIIAAVIAVVALINGVFPTIYQMSGSMTSVSDASNDRMKTEIKIICESANQTGYSLNVYVKNTCDRKMAEAYVGKTDVYFGTEASMSRCNRIGGANPAWRYSIMDGNNDTSWDPGETLNIWIVTSDHDFNVPGQRVKIVLYNGISAEDTFTL